MRKECLKEIFIGEYDPCAKNFFDGLEKLGLSEEELNAVPALFLPKLNGSYAYK